MVTPSARIKIGNNLPGTKRENVFASAMNRVQRENFPIIQSGYCMKNKVLLYIGDASIKYRSGISAYHWNLINTIDMQFDIIYSMKPDKSIVFPKNANVIVFGKTRKILFGILKNVIPFDILFHGYKIVITDGFTPLRMTRKMAIYTIIHDLLSITKKKDYSISAKIYFYFATKTYKQADKIITVSNNTKNEIIRLLGIDGNKIVVLPNVTDFVVKRDKTKDYFMYIGEMRKNKNLKNMMLGFIEYKDRTNSKTKLIICGKKRFEYNNLYDLVSSYTNDIVFTDYINDAQKKDYFSCTKGLVLISNDEGFGIPMIEAITNYIPVMASDIPVMHEVIFEAGIFVNQNDIYSIAEGFKKLSEFHITDEFIAACEKMQKKYSVESFRTLLADEISKYVEPVAKLG